MERMELRPYIERDVRYGDGDDCDPRADDPDDTTPDTTDEPNGIDEIMHGYYEHHAVGQPWDIPVDGEVMA